VTDPYLRHLQLALRAHEVPGPRIGEVMAEVEAHVAESGERPDEAFGPAEEYAATIAATIGEAPPPPETAAQRRKSAAVRWLSTYALAFGVMLLAATLGSPAELTPGWLVVTLLLPPAAEFVVSRLLHRGIALMRLWLIVAATAAGMLAALVTVDEPVLLRLPWSISLPIAVILLAAGAGRLRPDPVIDPRSGADRGPKLGWSTVLLFGALAAPLLLLIAIALTHR
jgi:hypothetical protein